MEEGTMRQEDVVTTNTAPETVQTEAAQPENGIPAEAQEKIDSEVDNNAPVASTEEVATTEESVASEEVASTDEVVG